MKNISVLIVTAITLLCFPTINFGQAPNLGTAGDFVFFSTTGAVGNTGVSSVTGKIGANDGPISGFDGITGQEESENIVTAQAAADLQAACDQLNADKPGSPSHLPLLGGGEILTPGVYLIGQAATLEGVLFLDAQGNSDAIFIFYIGGAFSPGLSSSISLVGGALACNVFWKVEGEIAIDMDCDMKGTFIANDGAISMANGSTLDGRALTTAGAIAVIEVAASLPTGCSNVLPIGLLSFTGACDNQNILLKWSTVTENNNNYFTVEGSPEGINWQVVGTVKGLASSSSLRTYSFTDRMPPTTIMYYRLKQTDFNGNYKYGNVVAVKKCLGNLPEGLTLYPNPSAGKFEVLFTGDKSQVHSIEIFNSRGEKVYESTHFQSKFDLSNHRPGIYFMRINLDSKIINRKISLNR